MDYILDADPDNAALLKPTYIPMCPECGSDSIFSDWSVKRITREEWEAGAEERETRRQRDRARGRFHVQVQTPGWPEDWQTAWTGDKITGYGCSACDFRADTEAPFIEARERVVAGKAAAKRRE